MDEIDSHIARPLHSFIEGESKGFTLIYDKIEDDKKSKSRKLLLYLDNLIDNLLQSDGDEKINFSHIHIPIPTEYHQLILEFMVMKLYLNSASSYGEQSTDETYVSDVIACLERELEKPIQLGATAGKRELNQKKEIRKKKRRLIKDFKRLKDLGIVKDQTKCFPKWLVHLLVKDYNFLVNDHSPSAFFVELDQFLHERSLPTRSYVLINSDKSLDELDSMDFEEKSVLEYIDNILLFDCTSRRTNQQFNFSNLQRFNSEGLSFKKLLIISLDTKPFRLNRLFSKLTSISTRYFVRPSGLNFHTYTIFPFEMDVLFEDFSLKHIEVNFIKCEGMIWQSFQSVISDYENLYELLSIKMRNIYSLSYTGQHKELIIEDIFDDNRKPVFISTDTKAEIFRLDENERLKIKRTLEDVLDIIIGINIPFFIHDFHATNIVDIVLPHQIFDHAKLLSLLQKQFQKCRLITWRDITNIQNDLIIMDYRDPGRFPFSIYPNLLEYKVSSNIKAKGFFLSIFFKRNYDHASFTFNQVLYEKIGDHRIRHEKFQWVNLIRLIRSNKPKNQLDSSLWDLDNAYSGNGERETVIIKYEKGSKKSFYPSQLFIAKLEDENHFFPLRADEIEDYLNESIISVQPLDELYEDINLFATSAEEENEIGLLKKHYNLSTEEQEHRLWKILLRRICDSKGIDNVYSQIKERLFSKGEAMVKESYFETNWVNIKSESLIPRSKRTFKVLCDFLNLPEVYFRVMLKKRASERLASRRSTTKMNHLIAGLMDKGMFDQITKNLTFDETFIDKHDLHELWFNVENLSTELQSLVDLLKPNIELVKVINAEYKSI